MEIQNPQELNDQSKAIFSLLPSEFTEKAVLSLPDRSREVILKRFGLKGEKEYTLEEIGKIFKITRERIRQIEKSAIAKIKNSSAKDILDFGLLFQNIISKNGGATEYIFFLDKVISFIEEDRGVKLKDVEEEKRSLVLIIALIGEIKHELENKKHKRIFYLDKESLDIFFLVIGEVIKFFTQEKKAMTLSDIFENMKENQALKERNINLTEESLSSYLLLSTEVGSDLRGYWGLKSWPFIFPKNTRDKAYSVFYYKREPLHFKKITQQINEVWTKKKKPALAETVHNELIKDKRFVLVGRGVYALAEWGYEKGTVQDIIKSILVKHSRPIKKEEIIKEVSAQRMVKPGTIILNLKNKNVFSLTEEGEYGLKMTNDK